MNAPATPEQILLDLTKRGIQLRLDGERLRFSAPPGAMTDELRSQLQSHKTDLIALLRDSPLSAIAEPGVRVFPPSFVQRRFWSLQQLNPTEGFYNAPFVFRLDGPLDTSVLRASFNAIVRRHEVLRSTLQQLNGELMQVIVPAGEINLTIEDVRGFPAADRAEQAEALLQADMAHPFDLARESGLRVLLVQTDRERFLLQLCLHNTLFDQSSLLVLLHELSLHYPALLAGEPDPLPPPTQYTEYVRWQESLASSGSEERLEYWKKWFERGDPPQWTWSVAPVPTPAVPDFHSHVTWQRCSPELTRGLKELSQRSGVTPYITLLAAYATILRRYTNCSDITMGTTYSNRHHWEFASLIGATIDVPALRIDLSDNPDLPALLGRMKDVVTSALTHQDVPFDRIGLQKPSRPLFRMVFSFFPETPHGRLRLPGIRVTFLEEEINELSRPDLYLVFFENQTEAGEILTGYWMHKQSVFTAGSAAQMSREFQTVLAGMVRETT